MVRYQQFLYGRNTARCYAFVLVPQQRSQRAGFFQNPSSEPKFYSPQTTDPFPTPSPSLPQQVSNEKWCSVLRKSWKSLFHHIDAELKPHYLPNLCYMIFPSCHNLKFPYFPLSDPSSDTFTGLTLSIYEPSGFATLFIKMEAFQDKTAFLLSFTSRFAHGGRLVWI